MPTATRKTNTSPKLCVSAAWAQVGNITLDLRGLTIVEFNDAEDTTHADVLAVFDKAIEATKGNP
jgi:hypothetical protein